MADLPPVGLIDAPPGTRGFHLAAPFADEQPSLERAWQGLRPHLLTVAVIILIIGGLNLLGYVLANLLFGSGPGPGAGMGQSSSADLNTSVRVALHQLLQISFTLAANLVGVLLTAVPALNYATGKVITPATALRLLAQRPLRYFLAGVLATVWIVVGLLLCVLPGLAIAMVMPVYINRIFTTDQSVGEALISSFQAVYGHAKAWQFLLIQLIAWLLLALVAVASLMVVVALTIGLRPILASQNIGLLIPYGALALAMTGASLLGSIILSQLTIFYVQNSAYRLGILS
jgi:hypothetical protein